MSKKEEKWKNLIVECGIAGRITTGVDVTIKCNSEDIIDKYNIHSLHWRVGSLDWNNGNGLLELNHRKGIITIDFPINDITIETKGFTIISDNTSLGTKIYYNGEDITSSIALANLDYKAGNAEMINELVMTVA